MATGRSRGDPAPSRNRGETSSGRRGACAACGRGRWLGQRLQAAERDAAQLREEESARQSFGRWVRLSAATTSVLLGVAVAVLSAWLLFPEPAKDRIISAAATIQTSWVAAKETVFGKLQPTTTPVPQPSVPNSGAGQPRALAAAPIDSRPEQIQMLSQVGAHFFGTTG